MLIKIGRRFEVEFGFGLYLFLRAPLFGEIYYSREQGLTYDSWRECKAIEAHRIEGAHEGDAAWAAKVAAAEAAAVAATP